MRPSSPSPLLVRSIPALWTLALGLWGLSRQDSVWRDEAATWQVARRSTAETVHMLANVDVVHGLYYLLMHGLFDLFGPGTAVLRLPSVVAMAVAASCVAALGHRLAGPWAGLGGGLALGLLPAVQFYLQEGRPYALVAAGAGISTLLLVTLLEGRGRAVHWVAYGGTVALGGLLNWLSLMILPAHLATLLWSRADRATGRRWAAAAVAAVACVLPLVLFSRSQSAQVSWIPPLTWHMLIGPAILLAIGGAGALLDRPRADGTRPDQPRSDRPRARRLSAAAVGLPLLAVPQLGLVGLSLIQPLFLDRYVLFSLLGLALLIGVAIGAAVEAVARRRPRAAPWVLPVVMAVAVAALLPQALAKRSPASRVDDVLTAAGDIRRMKKPGDAVLFIPAARRDTRLVSPDAFAGLRDIALARSPEESGTLKGTEARPDRIRAAMLAQRRILLVTDAPGVARPPATERERAKSSVLRTHFRPVADQQARGRRVTVYERRTGTPRPSGD
ncbi:glycosyltransferase family 39 protein [Streptomyces sp. ME02-6991-2A]|uniref:glycosyltransferase family 39 protein n=1 Tax=Streptomyces sp. ME02-6991-2A TaxID=3028677 RepID=UPI0029B81A03|nr:glycosyltransferase family 39 protein [Streptomyces sp. ME02-6991-2A]MDX3378295.1 glycosyltransferase family 39 protein [Streptomyces sp. ME02-6991-2A]